MDKILGQPKGEPADEEGLHVTSLSTKGIMLTKDHAIVEGVPGVNLFRYQLTTISALLDLENTREFQYNATCRIKIRAVHLGLNLGSGKTYCIHGLIKLKPIPRAIPEHIYVSTSREDGRNPYYNYGVYRRPQANDGRITTAKDQHPAINEIQIKYTNFLRPTVIVVGSGVMDHWIDTAKRFGLRYFVIGDARDLRKFYDVFKSNNVNVYDEIIVKNGTVTTNFTLDIEPAGSVPPNSIRPIIEVLKIMTSDYCWSRAVYDDFDTIRIPPTATTFPALFSIYVSATLNDEQAAKPIVWDPKASARVASEGGIVDHIREYGKVFIKDVPDDKLLHNLTTIRCDDAYVDECLKMPKAFKKNYVYTHAGKLFMEMLGKMGVDDAKEILEMISGDAIHTAAGRLGIQTGSVAEIARKVLNDNFDKYKSLTATLAHIRRYYENINELPENPDGEYSNGAVERIVDQITHKKNPTVEYYSARVLEGLDSHYNGIQTEVDKLSAAVKRVQDNFREGECIVCLNSLQGMTVFISTCCSVVVCGPCLSKACRLHVTGGYSVGDSTSITGMCPKCRVKINLRKDMIALEANFDPATLLNADPLNIEDEQAVPEVLAKPADPALPKGELGGFDDVTNPKIRALLNILHGTPIKAIRSEDLVLPNLLYGQDDRPVPEGTPRRVLVFASFDETLDNVKQELRSRSIPCDLLGGTYQQMTETIRKFEREGCVLLVNSKHYCAGINLQFVTEVVFMHKINNEHCEQQVCGRAQRIGRKYNLVVHYLLYENERA